MSPSEAIVVTAGGVMIIYKNTLICDKVYKSKKTELIAVEVETYQKPVVMCAAYRPPKTYIIFSIWETTLKSFQQHTKKLHFGLVVTLIYQMLTVI